MDDTLAEHASDGGSIPPASTSLWQRVLRYFGPGIAPGYVFVLVFGLCMALFTMGQLVYRIVRVLWTGACCPCP